jgi:NDP-sugar pyrophosphorylase family protein
MDCALIMAGGQGSRMRAFGAVAPKPLVRVAGTTLLEHNLAMLARHGCRRAYVAVAAAAAEIRAFIASRLIPLGAKLGVAVEELVEQVPLGNIGAAHRLANLGEVLVVFADNLTALDLAEFRAGHLRAGADLSLAAHEEPFRMPYGELRLASDDPERLADYVEKPEYRILVSSAVCMLGPRALAALPPDRATGMSELARSLLAQGAYVRVQRHAAPWIDVNDAAAIPRAEALLAAYPQSFSCPATAK